MYKVAVNIPTAITNVGPGLSTLGLALNLSMRIQMTTRADGELHVIYQGEGEGIVPADYRNPVLRAATRLFQAHEMAPVGLDIQINNPIPLGVGLGAEAAFIVGGLVAANNLIDAGLDREELLDLAFQLGIPRVVGLTGMLGGLNLCIHLEDGRPLYKSLEPPPLRVVVVVPYVPDYLAKTQHAMPHLVPLEAALFNMGRMVFMMDALVNGDVNRLAETMQDRLYQKAFTDHIVGYSQAVQAAKDNGAVAVTLASRGPTILAFANFNHTAIAESMIKVFKEAGIPQCRSWTLGIDAQGVTVSVAS